MKKRILFFIMIGVFSLCSYSNAMELNELQAKEYTKRAFKLVQSKDYDRAIEWLEKAIVTDPECALAYSQLGGIYANFKKDYDKAIEYFKKALSYDDKSVITYYGLGLCYYEADKKQKANVAESIVFNKF